MKIKVLDAFLMDGVRKTNDGYMTAFAKVARTGIQLYRGREVGKPDMDIVRVYRPPEEVFAKDAMKSMAHRPVTLLHPPVPVTADNWKQFATGMTGDEVVRDGDTVKVPLVIMDADTIAAVEKGGVRELSVGYSTDIKFTPGVTADGEAYDAVQTDIRANHLAVVPVARGGKELRIGDGGENPGDWVKSTTPKRNLKMKSIMIDGAAIEVADDNAATVISAHIEKLTKRLKDADEAFEKKDKEKKDCEDALKGEIAVLQAKVKDAEITPAKLDALVAARTAVVDAAKKVVGDADFAGKTEADIRRHVVTAKLGDAVVKDMSDAAVEGAFAALTADGVVQTGVQKLGAALGSSFTTTTTRTIADAKEAALIERDRQLSDAWKGAGANSAARQ